MIMHSITVAGVSTLIKLLHVISLEVLLELLSDYDGEITQGTIINKKDMPVFNMVLSDDVRYQSGEKVTAQFFSGNVMENGWDNDVNQLRINNSIGNLFVNDKLRGENSKIIGTVDYFYLYLRQILVFLEPRPSCRSYVFWYSK